MVYRMTGEWVFNRVIVGKVLAPPDECFGDEIELVGDGGCTYGRSHAQGRGGKFAGRNLVNREDFEDEMEVRLARPTYQRSLSEREHNREISSAAISARVVLDITSWEETDFSHDLPKGVLSRTLVWR